MTAIHDGQTERTMQLPQGPPPHPHQSSAMQGISVRARCLWLNTIQHCHSSCGKVMTGTTSNKSHLCHQVWMVAHPDHHRRNRQSYWDTAVQIIHAVCNWADANCPPVTRRTVPCRPFGIRTYTMVGMKGHARVGPCPEPAKVGSKRRERQWIPDPNNTPPALTSPAQLR